MNSLRALLLCVLLALCAPARAAPRLSYLYPAGGPRGATVKIAFEGSELDKATGFFTTGTGLTAKLEPTDKPNARTVEIAIAPDTPLGIQQVRLVGPDGLSNPKYFRVGQWPERAEQEPNDTRSAAPKVEMPVTINGRIQQNSDVDGVTFAAKAGQTVVCEIEALRVLGQVYESWLKGYMEIQDAAGNLLASSAGTVDDYYRWDPLLAFTAPKDGTYTVLYRDLGWRGAPMAVYRLTIGIVPHAVGLLPLGGQRGTSPTVRFLGPNLNGAQQAVAIPADAPDTLEIAYSGPNGATNLRPFHVSDLPDAHQNTANHSLQAAQAVPFPCAVNGQLAQEGARDYYRFKVEKPQRVVMEVYSRRVGTPMDAEITLFDGKGQRLQVDDDARERDCRIERDLPPGEYTVMVRDIDARGGPAFSYRLLLAPPQPALRLLATPDAPKLARGGTVNLTVKVEQRDGIEGDVTITAEGLPPAVTAAPLALPKDKQEGQITLTAAADCALGPIRLRITATGKAGAKTLHALARATETYNIQGTAFQRDLLGPILLVTEK